MLNAIFSKVSRAFQAALSFFALDTTSRGLRSALRVTKSYHNAVTVTDAVLYHAHYTRAYGLFPAPWIGTSALQNRLHTACMTANERLSDHVTSVVDSVEFKDQCLADLAAWAASHHIADESSLFPAETTVVFEVAGSLETDCNFAYFLIPKFTVSLGADTRILQAPYWVYRALAGLATVDSVLEVGAMWPSPSLDILNAALRLWDPLSSSVYQDFGVAFAAAKQLG